MMRFKLEYLYLLVLFIAPSAWTSQLDAPECEALVQFEYVNPPTFVYGRGLLWEISSVGTPSSYLFGTIHVSDESVVNLPEEVSAALNRAKIFAMEVVPEYAEMMTFASLMYFSDGQKLSDLLSSSLYNEVVRLLSPYHLHEESVVLMKPWAAYLTMSYPPEFGQVLDMQLLGRARQNGARVLGLESLQEQIDIFDKMALDKQLKLLGDTACHYDIIEADFEKMKSLYLARDLAGLYAYSQRYFAADDALYSELIKKLLIDRNYTMAERMQAVLKEGNAFIAIGAMHLVGEEGVLALLAKNNYDISLVY